MTKAEFIRSLPNLATRDLVAKAKEAGFTISEDYVYKLRSFDRKAKGGAAKPAAAKSAAAPKAAKKRAKKAGKKAAGKAKKAGRKAAAPKATKRGRKRAAAPAASAPAAGGLEAKFINMALDLGLARAEGIFAELRKRLKGMSL